MPEVSNQGGTTVAQLRQPLVFIVSGPSGVGKDSVINQLKKRKTDLHFIVTATTRPKRETEVEGVDYLFVTKAQFESMIERGALLEHALVYGEYKGVPKDQVYTALEAGKDVILRLDVQGAATIRQIFPQAVTIFLMPDNEEQLINRLKARQTETQEQLDVRIATVRQELKRLNEFDYAVVNQDQKLDETLEVIIAIIQAERHRVRSHPLMV